MKEYWGQKAFLCPTAGKMISEYYFATCYEDNTLSKEADSTETERAENHDQQELFA